MTVGARPFGAVDQLPNGAWRARWPVSGTRRAKTFKTERDARKHLRLMEADSIKGVLEVGPSKMTLTEFIETIYYKQRVIKARTMDDYEIMRRRFITEQIGWMKLSQITSETIDDWYATTAVTAPSLRSNVYTFLSGVFNFAVYKKKITGNPCQIKNASKKNRVTESVPATIEELTIIANLVPGRYKLMVLLAAYCALRRGEISELRVSDFNMKRKTVSITRAMSWVKDKAVIGLPLPVDEDESPASASHVDTPKSKAGTRTLPIPRQLLPLIEAHIKEHTTGEPGALLFPAAGDPTGHMRPSTFNAVYWRARKIAGRPDLRFHDLRHTGATMMAQEGATQKELMVFGGWETGVAALRYQAVEQGRLELLADKLADRALRAEVNESVAQQELPQVRALRRA